MGYHRWDSSDFKGTVRSRYLQVLKEYNHNLLGIIGTGGFDVFSIINDLRRGLLLPEIEYFVIAVRKRYGISEQAAREVVVNLMLGDTSIKGRKVLLVDEISDKGDSSERAYETVKQREPADVKLFVVDSKINLTVPGWYARRSDVWEIYPKEVMETIPLLILGESEKPNAGEKIDDIVHRMGTSKRELIIQRITQKMRDAKVKLPDILFLYKALENLGMKDGLYSILDSVIKEL